MIPKILIWLLATILPTTAVLAAAQHPVQGGGSLRKLANVHKVPYYEHRSIRGRAS